jgi:hypothetical protein
MLHILSKNLKTALMIPRIQLKMKFYVLP